VCGGGGTSNAGLGYVNCTVHRGIKQVTSCTHIPKATPPHSLMLPHPVQHGVALQGGVIIQGEACLQVSRLSSIAMVSMLT
jgi:hypothetical protein